MTLLGVLGAFILVDLAAVVVHLIPHAKPLSFEATLRVHHPELVDVVQVGDGVARVVALHTERVL